MKKIALALVLNLLAFNAHAGFQFGMVCKDDRNAKYLFSEGYVGSRSTGDMNANPTQCLEGRCQMAIQLIKGITTDGGMGLGRAIDVEVKDDELSKLAGQDLRIVVKNGQVLVCGERRHLREIPGQGD